MLPVQSLETVEHYMGFSEESETQQINRDPVQLEVWSFCREMISSKKSTYHFQWKALKYKQEPLFCGHAKETCIL